LLRAEIAERLLARLGFGGFHLLMQVMNFDHCPPNRGGLHSPPSY
jgi:hypothetical protein